MKQDTKEIIAGIVLFAISATFFYYVFTMKKEFDTSDSDAKYYTVNAGFQDIEGISIGSQVRIAGVNIGNVTGIDLSTAFKSQVKMKILNEVKLPADSAIVVESDGLFGGKYLEILPGAEEIYIADGGYLYYAQDVIRLSMILERIVDYTKIKQEECNLCLAKEGKIK